MAKTGLRSCLLCSFLVESYKFIRQNVSNILEIVQYSVPISFADLYYFQIYAPSLLGPQIAAWRRWTMVVLHYVCVVDSGAPNPLSEHLRLLFTW